MASDIEFLETRIRQLEKNYEAVITLLGGTVSEAAIQRLIALRQSEIIELKDEVETLRTLVNNLISQA